ncbi:MAG: hypothetical protein R2762_21880 [Bryobacteraceae bacterium]
MPPTFLELTANYRRRAQSAGTQIKPADPKSGISYELWNQFQAAVTDALIPYKEPREKVIQAVIELQDKLGFAI